MRKHVNLLSTCEIAARAGAQQLLAWRGRFSTSEKSPKDLVTDADLASQQAIFAVISQQFPEHSFLGEENQDDRSVEEQLGEPYCWVVDPLDGTTNYVHGFPFYAVSVAVTHRGKLLAGVVLDPLREECFSAAEGEGAWLNRHPIRPSTTTELEDSLLAVSLPPQVDLQSSDLRAFMEVVPACRAVRRTGSAALNLAYVACGRLDGHWAHHIFPWDAAAGVLLVREAGGIATASSGKPFDLARADYLVAGTPALHQVLLGRVASGVSDG